MKRNVKIHNPAIMPIVDKVSLVGEDIPEIVTITPEDYSDPNGVMRVSLLQSKRLSENTAVGILDDIVHNPQINPLNLDLSPHKYTKVEYKQHLMDDFCIPSTVKDLFLDCEMDYINNNPENYLENSDVIDCCEFYGAISDKEPFTFFDETVTKGFAAFDIRAIGGKGILPYFLEKAFLKNGNVKFILFIDVRFGISPELSSQEAPPVVKMSSFESMIVFNVSPTSKFFQCGPIFNDEKTEL